MHTLMDRHCKQPREDLDFTRRRRHNDDGKTKTNQFITSQTALI